MPRRQAAQATTWPPAPNGEQHPIRIDKDGNKWTSITHDRHERRAVSLKDFAQASPIKGNYDIPPTRGAETFDITAYHPGQRTWGAGRDRRPAILFQHKRTSYRNAPALALIDNLGNIILDEDNHPIRAFDVLPLTISTEVEGWRLEAWHRMDSRINYKDIRARMLIRFDKGKTWPTTCNFNQKRSRARHSMRCLAWPKTGEPKEKSDNFGKLLDAEMTEAMKTQNSTRGMTDLTSDEITAVENSGYGTGLANAGKKALPKETRDSKWKTASILADKDGVLPRIDPAMYHQGWIHVRGFGFPMIKAKTDAEIAESAGQGPSAFQGPSNSSRGNTIHGSQSGLSTDTQLVLEEQTLLSRGPSSQYLVRLDRQWEVLVEPQSSSSSSGGGSGWVSHPNGVQQGRKRMFQDFELDDDENHGSEPNAFNQLLTSVAPSASRIRGGSPNVTTHEGSRSRQDTAPAASHKRQKILGSGTSNENMGNMRNPPQKSTSRSQNLRQGPSTASSCRRKPSQSSKAGRFPHTQTGFQSRPVMETSSPEPFGIQNRPQDQDNRLEYAGFIHDDHYPRHANSAGFDSNGGLRPHASNATRNTPRGNFEGFDCGLSNGDESMNDDENMIFPLLVSSMPPREPAWNATGPSVRQVHGDQMYRPQHSHLHTRMYDQVEYPPSHQTYPGPTEDVSRLNPVQTSYIDGLEDIEPFELPQSDDDWLNEWKDQPPGKYPSLDGAPDQSTPPEAASVNGGNPGDHMPEQDLSPRLSDNGIFDTFTINSEWVAEQTPDSASTGIPIDPIDEENPLVKEAEARNLSSSIAVQQSRGFDERDSAPLKDIVPDATVHIVSEPTTQPEELSQPHHAAVVTVESEVEQHGSLSASNTLIKEGPIGETTINGEQYGLSDTARQCQHVGHDTGDSSSYLLGSTEDGGWQEAWNDDLREWPRTPPAWNPEWDQPRELGSPPESPLPPDATDEELDALVEEYIRNAQGFS